MGPGGPEQEIFWIWATIAQVVKKQCQQSEVPALPGSGPAWDSGSWEWYPGGTLVVWSEAQTFRVTNSMLEYY